MGEPAVELVHLIKRFGDVVAVDDVSLKIEDGEFFSLLRPSGCGKTTTLRVIAGLESETATDQGKYSDLVEITEMIRHTTKPMVHRTLTVEHGDAAVEMLSMKNSSRAHDLLATHKPEPLGAKVEAEMERILQSHLGKDFHFEPLAT